MNDWSRYYTEYSACPCTCLAYRGCRWPRHWSTDQRSQAVLKLLTAFILIVQLASSRWNSKLNSFVKIRTQNIQNLLLKMQVHRKWCKKSKPLLWTWVTAKVVSAIATTLWSIKKQDTFIFSITLGKYWRIFIIFSPLYSARNCGIRTC